VIAGRAVAGLSQCVQYSYVADLPDGRGVGYLLKDRVAHIEEFVAALRPDRGPLHAPAIQPQRRDPLSVLSARECEVLALMAEGSQDAAGSSSRPV